jgi:hypothetical protein
VLVTVIGCVIGMSAARGAITAEIATLAFASASALGAVDVIYVARRIIPRIYLLDAVAEALLIAAWLLALRITA